MKNTLKAIALTAVTLTGLTACSAPAPLGTENGEKPEVWAEMKGSAPESIPQFRGFEEIPSGWESSSEDNTELTNENCKVVGRSYEQAASPLGLGDTYVTNYAFQNTFESALHSPTTPERGSVEIDGYGFLSFVYELDDVQPELNDNLEVVDTTVKPMNKLTVIRSFDKSYPVEESPEKKVSPVLLFDAQCDADEDFQSDDINAIIESAMIVDETTSEESNDN